MSIDHGGSAKRACVIGAGPSGLPVVKALGDRGIDFDCFERSDRVGGLWVFGNASRITSIYASLHTNTSRERMAMPISRCRPVIPTSRITPRWPATSTHTRTADTEAGRTARRWPDRCFGQLHQHTSVVTTDSCEVCANHLLLL